MKNILLIIVFLIAASCQSQNQEIKKAIETFFDGFHVKDSIIIKSVCNSKMIL